ncbi:MAG: hypothetical protein AVDCRST_MAG02-4525 [uncultured Rubrobacteraceae bacterium]|uniref:Uncharacterized protein n=1 Tax=uncultured Rubrobacteraceae bacterium TaxID=349277 RepID=A0A6J4S165_9ACTN|nr:MAG: hypothetical protein AVDCRST_MAG02-4525 [uncultured Rubrobacteraceae bacterium]
MQGKDPLRAIGSEGRRGAYSSGLRANGRRRVAINGRWSPSQTGRPANHGVGEPAPSNDAVDDRGAHGLWVGPGVGQRTSTAPR